MPTRHPLAVAVAVTLAVAVAVVPQTSKTAQTQRQINLGDIATIQTPISSEISPDGERILFERVTPDVGTGAFRVSLWSVATEGGEAVELVGGAQLARWSPDGSSIAYLSREGGRLRLWRAAADGTNRVALDTGGLIPLDYAWSPDGGRIAFIADSASVRQVHVVDVGTAEVRRVTDVTGRIVVHPWDPGANLSWSPDGRSIAFSVKPSDRFDDDYRTDVYVAEANGGGARALVERPGMDMRALWSPDGRMLVFRTTSGAVDRFADHALAFVDIATGTIRDVPMEHGFLDGPYIYGWRHDGGAVLYTAAVPEGVGLFSLDAEAGTIVRLDDGGVHGTLSVAAGADRVAFVRSDPDRPWEVWTSPATGYRPERLTDLNAHLAGAATARVEVVRWASEGDTISGVLYSPAERVEPGPLPVVTIVHGGPEGQGLAGFYAELPSPRFTLDGTLYPPHLLAAQGWLVFVPNFRGSGGHGRELRRAGNRDWSRTFLADIESGLDALVARGLADSTRLFLIGSRSGATKVVSLLTNTTRFRAAVAHTPYPDLEAEYTSGDGDFRLMHEGLMGGPPDSATWARHSPILHADRIRTPLLIVTEEDAAGISPGQSLALQARLWSNRVPGELILYRGRSLQDTRELLRRILAWFEAWAEPPPG